MSTIASSPTSIKLPSALKERLHNLSELKDKSSHALIIQAVEHYVEREEKREKLRQDAIKAHDEYMMTGLHLSNDEAKSWLEELAKGKDAEPPRCHQ